MRHPHPHVLANHLRATADALDKHGERAISLARLLSDRGWPPQTLAGGSGQGISDPTQRAALQPYTDELARLAKQMRNVWKAALDLESVITHVIAHAEDVISYDADSCRSCRRDGNYFEPLADKRYRDLCRWCGDWKGAYGQMPPLNIIKARHRGQRITTKMVEQALGRRAS